jgi:hypothetical protein
MLKTAIKKISTGALLLIVGSFFFVLGLGIGLSDNEAIEIEKEVVKEVPVVTTKEIEVEKVVYKDSQETLDQLKSHNQIACSYASVYPSMFDIMKAYASDWGLSDMVTSDMYNLESIANEYVAEYCD